MRPRWLLLVAVLIAAAAAGWFARGHPGAAGGTLRVSLFAGGNEDSDFSRIIARGAGQAARDLAVDLRLVWSGWDNPTMARQLKEEIERAPHGIAVMGHPGEEVMLPLIEEAQRKGIRITALNVDLPGAERRFTAQGMGYAGQDVLGSGRRLASAAIKAFEIPPGSTVLLTGVKQYPIRGERTIGAERALVEAGMRVIYIQDDYDMPAFVAAIRRELGQHPEIGLIVDDCDVVTMAELLQRDGVAHDRYRVVGFDLSPATVRLMRSGHIDLVSDQQPYLQGYLAVLQLAMTVRHGFAGLHIDTGTSFIHPGNLEAIAPLVESGIR